ncbi:MAG: hypothetical protein KC731_17690 [Myxococcales bacterium]|nr:hypothetical protein [Myxococcales bacterium]
MLLARLPPLALALVIAGCHSAPQPSQDTSATAAEPASAPPPVDRPATRTPPPTSPDEGAPASEVTLGSGAVLPLPAGATQKPFDAAKRLPEGVEAAHLFNLGSPKRLLMVNEMDLGGRTCAAALDEEKKRMRAAQDDTDPERLKYRKVSFFEELDVDGQHYLYGESKNRGLGPATGEERPMVGMGTLLMCRDETYVALMAVTDQTDLPQGMKGLLLDVAKGYKAKR